MSHYSSFFILASCLAATLQDQQHVEVEAGQNVLLQCLAPRDMQVLMLEWIRSDLGPEDYVFFYREKRSYENYQHPCFRGRVKLGDSSSVEDGDVSVVLQNASVADAGTYECLITVRSSGSSQRDFSVVRRSVGLNVASAPRGEYAKFKLTEQGGQKDGGGRTSASALLLLLLLAVLMV